MSMQYLARDTAASLHHRASYIQQAYEGLVADLREIASVNPEKNVAMFEQLKTDMLTAYGYQPVQNEKPFAYADGVAIIPIHGLLLNRLSWSYSFATGYNFIRSQRNAALADDDVTLIVYDINSPGGMAAGCVELAREMFETRDVKPSLSVVDSNCYSAAYFLGSAAQKIVVTPSGGVGSIGCLSIHVDYSDMLVQEGIKITFIVAGAEKVDGNPYQKLSNRAKNSIQQDVDYHYGLFVSSVALHRGIPEEDVIATQAGCYQPPEALDLGLIDAVQTPEEAVSDFFNEITSNDDDNDVDDDDDGGDEIMKTNNGTTGAAPVAGGTAPAVELKNEPQQVAGLTQADVAAAVTAALTAERTRTSGIRTCDEAKDRPKLASHLADNTSMSIDDARSILAQAAKETPEPAVGGAGQAGAFRQAMSDTPNPSVGADHAGNGGDGSGGGGADTPEARAGSILSSWAAATGNKVLPRPGHA